MALTRAQLLMGNSGQGALLTGQPQGVIAGIGITINANGTIDVNSQSVQGIMKLGQTTATANAAYNGYEWPTATGTVDQQLTIDSIAGGVTTLKWKDPDMIPWTTKGQLVVGTGANTQTILNSGTNGQILVVDTSSASGLAYTGNYVSTTSSTGAANIPAGGTALQPATPATGALRYNSDTTSLEFYNGGGWETVASSTTNGFVEKTSSTGAAIIPSGTAVQRPGAALGGYFRFNDDTDKMEFWDGGAWQTVASSSSGTFIGSVTATAPAGATNMAAIPGGTSAQRASAPLVAGYFRYNSDLGGMEFYNGSAWTPLANISATSSVGLGLAVSGANSEIIKVSITSSAIPPVAGTGIAQAIPGSVYFDSEYGSFFYRYVGASSTAWVQSTGSNTDGGVLDFPAGPAGGATYAAPNGITYTFDGTKGVWTVGGSSGGVTSFSAGTTGLLPSAATTGAITLSGQLNVLNGGTGATTASGALTNLLPTQTGNAGKYLTTDSTTTSWATAVSSVNVVGSNGITTTGGPITTTGTITVDFPINLLTPLP